MKVARPRLQAKERAMRIEEQVQELSVKLAQLEGEKAGLAARNRALEAALVSAKTAVAQVRWAFHIQCHP